MRAVDLGSRHRAGHGRPEGQRSEPRLPGLSTPLSRKSAVWIS